MFPAYEKSNMTEVATRHLVLVLEVVERTRYTTLMRVTQRGQHGLPAMGLDVRLYHDASMAEIIAFQRHRRLAGRYAIPTPTCTNGTRRFNRIATSPNCSNRAWPKVGSMSMSAAGWNMTAEQRLRGEYQLANGGALTLIQVTDTHLMATPGGRLLNVDTDDSLAAVIELVLQQQSDTDALLITGDISGDGADSAYGRLAQALSVVPAPSFWLPGNHDECRGDETHADRFIRCLSNPHWLVVLLDSQQSGESVATWRHRNCRLCPGPWTGPAEEENTCWSPPIIHCIRWVATGWIPSASPTLPPSRWRWSAAPAAGGGGFRSRASGQ